MSKQQPTPSSANHDAQRPAWLDPVLRDLDQSLEDLDAASASRLNRARQAALEVARAQRTPRWVWQLGFAAAASFALVLALSPALRAPTTAQLPVAEVALKANDLELLASNEGLDWYRDLEFYAWLDAQQPADG